MRDWLGVVPGGRTCDRTTGASTCADRAQRARERLRPDAAVRHQHVHAQGHRIAHPVRHLWYGQPRAVREFFEAASHRAGRHRRDGMAAARSAGAARGSTNAQEHKRGCWVTTSNPPGRTAPERPLRIETSISRSSMPQPRLLILRSMARISMMAACGNGRLRALATMIGWRPVRILCWKESASAFWWQLRYTVGVYRMGRCRSAGSI